MPTLDLGLKTIYEDTCTFKLDGITFAIYCRIDQYGQHYSPDAMNKDGARASGRMLPWRDPFNGLNFANPPAWLINAISPDYSMYTEPQRATRKEPAQPAELYIPLWELPKIQGSLKYWAREHPFIGRTRTLFKAYKSRRGTIEICQFAMHETAHLEIRVYDAATQSYGEAERIPGDQAVLEGIAATMAVVAGMREVKVKQPKPKREKKAKVIRFGDYLSEEL